MRGVQRDLLPIVEGCTVSTRYGPVRTEHILFIGAGAFHGSKPSDLIPELQGRFPIRVELDSLRKDDFLRILREPENALPRQYSELLATEGVSLQFEDSGLEKLAEMAWDLNQTTQNIGARRLYTLLEKLLEELLFAAPDLIAAHQKNSQIDQQFVESRLKELVRDEDQSAYIL